MKYKVGDRVRIKSIDWYNENRDEADKVECGNDYFVSDMVKYCGEIVTILSVLPAIYYIKEDDGIFIWTDEMIESLVERNGKTYPYKIGDRVILKGNNRCATITDLKYNSWGNLSYYIKIDNDEDISVDYPTELLLPYDNKIEGLVEDEVGLVDNLSSRWVNEFNLPDGYIFKDENGNVINATKIVVEKKKNEYPKTYEECAKELGYNQVMPKGLILGYMGTLLSVFQKLLICRDAYWKLYGEEMGLGKPWEPDYKNPDIDFYVIINIYNRAEKAKYGYGFQQCIFTFPTEEMRDAFKENFKGLIEECKELL